MNGPLDDGTVGLRFKGLPPALAAETLDGIGGRGLGLFDSGFGWPLMVLRDSALRHNAAVMAGYAAARGMLLAPHLKTTSSPHIAGYAMREGAWGVTVATPFQARVFMAAGHRRVLLANQLVERSFAREAAAWTAAGKDREFYCYVDSVAGVELLDGALEPGTSLSVLIEVGHAGGRGGCRDDATISAVTAAVRRSDRLILAGVSGYEGSVSHARDGSGLSSVRAYLRRLRATMASVLPYCENPLISAGGSLYFDLVAEELASDRYRVIARPGAYLTHDHGLYRSLSPLDGDAAGPPRLRPAIEVWAPVLTRPEPGLAILGAGRRDLNHDEGLPAVLEIRDHLGRDARPAGGWEITALNDQHAYARLPEGSPAGPGDLVRLGISHPCTAHDRWLTAVIADDADTVVAVARCYF
ncbi:alanine racemase [Spirillospora sp. NPDC029432]|uniref:alanine racemase n=1 Tax=Spirillospora sp. NPDC029432 TaxID=3154599 RepID=UPI003451F7AB